MRTKAFTEAEAKFHGSTKGALSAHATFERVRSRFSSSSWLVTGLATSSDTHAKDIVKGKKEAMFAMYFKGCKTKPKEAYEAQKETIYTGETKCEQDL